MPRFEIKFTASTESAKAFVSMAIEDCQDVEWRMIHNDETKISRRKSTSKTVVPGKTAFTIIRDRLMQPGVVNTEELQRELMKHGNYSKNASKSAVSLMRLAGVVDKDEKGLISLTKATMSDEEMSKKINTYRARKWK